MKILLEYLNAETWEVCAVQEQRIHLLSYQIIHHDKWIGGILHYTGMGKSGDQDIHWAQNATLAESDYNGVDVHLFEVIDAGEYNPTAEE